MYAYTKIHTPHSRPYTAGRKGTTSMTTAVRQFLHHPSEARPVVWDRVSASVSVRVRVMINEWVVLDSA